MLSLRQDPRLGLLAICASSLGFGLSPYLATKVLDSGVTSLSASAVRVTVLLVALLPVAPQIRGWAKEAAVAAVGGAISMVGLTGFFFALERAPVASATVVYYTYPAAVLTLSALIGRRRLAGWEVAACAAILTGVVLAVGPLGMSRNVIFALAPAFAAPVGWAIYLFILSGPIALMPTLPKVFAGSCGGTLALLPLALWRSSGALMPLTRGATTSMALLVLCTLAIPATLVSWGTARTGERTAAMVGTLEFTVAIAAGWLLMGVSLSPAQLVGVVLVLGAALYAANRYRSSTMTPATRRRRSEQPAQPLLA